MSTTPLLTKISPVQVSRDVYLLKPVDGATKVGKDEPEVVLLFGWMDAKLRPLLTYMEKYSTLYPAATQILIISRGSANWSSKANNLKALRPAVDILKSLGFLGPNPPSSLVHVFSNGGGFQLLLLSELLNEATSNGNSKTLTSTSSQGLILDSSPGGAGLGPALLSFTGTMRSLWMKVLVSIPLVILYGIIMGAAFLTGKPDPYTRLRTGLLNAQLLPWLDARTPRVYVYSKDDEIVMGRDVAAHADLAREKGLDVTVEEFSKSKHVAHSRMDPGRYWCIVQNLWAKAVEVYSGH